MIPVGGSALAVSNVAIGACALAGKVVIAGSAVASLAFGISAIAIGVLALLAIAFYLYQNRAVPESPSLTTKQALEFRQEVIRRSLELVREQDHLDETRERMGWKPERPVRCIPATEVFGLCGQPPVGPVGSLPFPDAALYPHKVV